MGRMRAKSGHPPTGFGAGPAGLRAALPVLHVVLGAILAAGIADRRAERADLARKPTLAAMRAAGS